MSFAKGKAERRLNFVQNETQIEQQKAKRNFFPICRQKSGFSAFLHNVFESVRRTWILFAIAFFRVLLICAIEFGEYFYGLQNDVSCFLVFWEFGKDKEHCSHFLISYCQYGSLCDKIFLCGQASIGVVGLLRVWKCFFMGCKNASCIFGLCGFFTSKFWILTLKCSLNSPLLKSPKNF